MTNRKSMTAEQLEVVRRKDRERYAAKKKDPAFCAHHYASSMEWKQSHHERCLELQRAAMKRYRQKHPEYSKKFNDKQRRVFATDAKAYAAHREYFREYGRKLRESEGKIYHPRLSSRIPDYCVLGECVRIARRSPFLRVNIGKERLLEIDGFARELFTERK